MPTLTERARAHRETAKAVPVGRMTLAQFAGSGRVVVIYSDVLGEEVLLAADNARLPEGETRPVYRARELAGLAEWSADGLRLLHEVKARFGAEIEAEAQERNVPCLNL